MTTPIVSVIVPVYNVAPYLDECIESVICQDCQDWECILVDDGSTDGSSEKCDLWSDKDRRISVVHQKNQGVSFARNCGIQLAKGMYIYLLDADDWCECNIFPDEVKSDIIIGEFYINRADEVESVKFADEIVNNAGLAFLTEEVRACIGTYFIKRDILETNKILFDTAFMYGEDMNFTLKCLLHSHVIQYDRRPYMHYRINMESATYKLTLRRFDVYFSWLSMIEYANKLNNIAVAAYLQKNMLPKSLMSCSKDLVQEGLKMKDLVAFYKEHKVMGFTLRRAIIVQSKNIMGKYAQLLYECPKLFFYWVILQKKYYDTRRVLGLLRRVFYSTKR